MGLLPGRRHAWRHHLDQQKWRRRRRMVRIVLLSAAFAEVCCLRLQGAFADGSLAFRMIRTEEAWQTELFTIRVQEELWPADVYGVRFDPERMEVRFYHRKESIIHH